MTVNANEIAHKLREIAPSENVWFVCIGTDRSTGDSLGPMVGTMLKQRGVKNVIGTLHEPCHAMNMEERLSIIPEDAFVVAIDACLGSTGSIGKVRVKPEPLRPGAGVNKTLPTVGNACIHGIVNVGGFMEYFVLQNTRLSLIMDMAEEIAAGIEDFAKVVAV